MKAGRRHGLAVLFVLIVAVLSRECALNGTGHLAFGNGPGAGDGLCCEHSSEDYVHRPEVPSRKSCRMPAGAPPAGISTIPCSRFRMPATDFCGTWKPARRGMSCFRTNRIWRRIPGSRRGCGNTTGRPTRTPASGSTSGAPGRRPRGPDGRGLCGVYDG